MPLAISSVEELYGGGETGNLLNSQFNQDQRVYHWLQRRHEKGDMLLDDDGCYRRRGHVWKVPYGVRDALKSKLVHSQLNNRYPFFVTWVSPKTGKRLRKNFETLGHAIVFIAEQAQYVDPQACVVAKIGFYIPTKLMGKFPRRMKDAQGRERHHYWCPRCMAPRVFRRSVETFFAERKEWSEEKQRFVMKDRQLALTHCTTCGISNRDHKFRKSNQPMEKRTFKQGVRRARKRRKR